MLSTALDDQGKVKEVAFSSPYNVNEAGAPVAYDTDDASTCFDEVLSVAEPLKQSANMLAASPKSSMPSPKASVLNFLQTVPLLFALTAEQIAGLDVMVREYDEMNVVIEEGLLLQHIYVLASGTVEVMNSKRGFKRAVGHRRVGSITAPSVFGVDEAILENPAQYTYHASSVATILLIPKKQIVALFAQSPIFANNVSVQILQTLPSFSLFQDFCRSIFGLSTALQDASQDEGYRLSLPIVVGIFKRSGTVLHKLANKNEIDVDALRYCVKRLPLNITETYSLILATVLPDYIYNEFIADAAASGRTGLGPTTVPVDTGKRRRCAWTYGGGGQTLVMMRDGFTDTIDFISNLCIFVIETNKIRARLRQLVFPSAVEILRDALTAQKEVNDPLATLERLPFSPAEVSALQEMWGSRVLEQLDHIVEHREEYVVRMESHTAKRFAPDPYSNWSLTILRHIKRNMEIPDDQDLPADVVIDVLFSPNRTLKNLFCSMSNEFKEFVENEQTKSGEAKGASIWKNEEDRYYYILTGLLERENTVRDAYRARLESNGFTLLEDAHASALIVDLIDVSKISVEDTDSALQDCARRGKERSQNGNRHFIVNVDKTFGAQIESVLRALLLTFGNRIRSVNLTGKAGGLVGNRGDVVLPSKLLFSKQSFSEDSTDEIRLCNNASLTTEDITPFLGKSSSARVHQGTLITIPGIVLQSDQVMKFYKVVHGCTALEMQSSYIARQLEECRRAGVLTRKLTSRYLFYFDDMPLGNEDGSQLKPLKREIISTIYASARSLLCQILAS